MPKRSFKVSAEAAKSELDTSNYYAGDTPPNGTYRGVMKKIWFKETTKEPKNDAWNTLFEIREPKDSPKSKYNGAGIFEWYNLTDAGAPFVNTMLSALGIARNIDEAMANGGYVTDEEDPPNVTKIGKKRLTGEIECRFATKIDDRGNAKIVRVLAAEDSEPEESEDEPEGLGESLEDGETEGEGDEESGIYTEEELDALELSDLKEIAAQYEIELSPKARKATIMTAILEAQEAALAEDDIPDAEEIAADADAEEAAAEEVEAISEEELEELDLGDLKEHADSIGMEYAPKITKPKLIEAIVAFQDAEPEEEAEEDEEETDAEAEASAEIYTEDDLMELELGDLKDMVTSLGVALPKPPIKRKLVTAILEAQAASGTPPF